MSLEAVKQATDFRLPMCRTQDDTHSECGDSMGESPLYTHSTEQVLSSQLTNAKFKEGLDLKNCLSSLLALHESRLTNLKTIKGARSGSTEQNLEYDRLEHRIETINQLIKMCEDNPNLKIATFGFANCCSNVIPKCPGISALDTVVIQSNSKNTVYRLSSSISLQAAGVLDKVKNTETTQELTFVARNFKCHASDLSKLEIADLQKGSLNGTSYDLPCTPPTSNSPCLPPVSRPKTVVSEQVIEQHFPHLVAVIKEVNPLNTYLRALIDGYTKTPEGPLKNNFKNNIEEFAPEADTEAAYKKSLSVFKKYSKTPEYHTKKGQVTLYNTYSKEDVAIDQWVDFALGKDSKSDTRNCEDDGSLRKKGEFYPEPGWLPLGQVVNRNSEDVRILAVLTNASQDYPLFKYDDSYKVEPKIAQTLLDMYIVKKDFNFYQLHTALQTAYPGIKQDDYKHIVKNLLKQLKAYGTFLDAKGICCPTCPSEGHDHLHKHEGASKVSSDPTPPPLVILGSEISLESMPLAKREDFKTYMARYKNYVEKVLEQGFSKDIRGELKAGFNENINYWLNANDAKDDFKFANILNYTNNIVAMIDHYDVAMKDHYGSHNLESLKNAFQNLLANLLDQFSFHISTKLPAEKDLSLYECRFDYARECSYALRLLKDSSFTISNQEYIEAYLESIHIDLGDPSKEKTEEKKFFDEYRHNTHPRIEDIDITVPFQDQLQNLMCPTGVMFFVGASAAGKSTVLRDGTQPLIRRTEDKSGFNIRITRPTEDRGSFSSEEKEEMPEEYSVFQLQNDETGASRNEGYSAFHFRIMVSKDAKFEYRLNELIAKEGKLVNLTDKEKSKARKQGASEDGQADAPGCVCCKDRHVSEQFISDRNRSGNKYYRFLAMETQGLVDLPGVLNMAKRVNGRMHYHQAVVVVDPMDPRWQQVDSLIKFCNLKKILYEEIPEILDPRNKDHFTLIKDLGLKIDSNYVKQLKNVMEMVDLGLEGVKNCDLQKESYQKIKDVKKTFQTIQQKFAEIKIHMASCRLATDVVINKHDYGDAVEHESRYKALFSERMKFINSTTDASTLVSSISPFKLHEGSYNTEQLALSGEIAIDRTKIPIEIADFTGESEEANLESHYFVLPKAFISNRANQEKFLGLIGTMMDEGYLNRLHTGPIPLPIANQCTIIKTPTDGPKAIEDRLGRLSSATTESQYFTMAAGRYNLQLKPKPFLGG